MESCESRRVGVLRAALKGGGDILEIVRLRASSMCDCFVWDSARFGTTGASVEEVEERGWLVTVAVRLGKYDVNGLASIGEHSKGEISGEVIDEV